MKKRDRDIILSLRFRREDCRDNYTVNNNNDTAMGPVSWCPTAKFREECKMLGIRLMSSLKSGVRGTTILVVYVWRTLVNGHSKGYGN